MDGPSKVDGLLTESGRSIRKWTVYLKVDGPLESGRFWGKVDGLSETLTLTSTLIWMLP